MQPNIILILTDHFRPDAIGRSTPNLNKLAARGARFHNAYCSSPLCMPSRVSMVTGLYPSQNGVCGNMAAPVPEHIRRDTFPNHLQQAGYHTALIGKHHFIDHYGLKVDALDDDDQIAAYGFDHVFQVLSEVGPPWGHNECHYTRYLKERGIFEDYVSIYRKNAWGGGEFPFPEDDYDDAFIGRHGVEFIEGVDDSRPFYLNLSFHGPHPPNWHPGDLQHKPADMPPPLGAPDGARVRHSRAHFMDKCALIDKYIGNLLKAVDERGMTDRTVVIFTSDHGDNLGDFGIFDKRFYYEQSVGVPMIMAGPGVPRGERDMVQRDCRSFVSLIDLYPTILGLAGVDTQPLTHPLVQPHEDAHEGPIGPQRDGRDLLAMLRGERGSMRDAVFSELGTTTMVRTANWKLSFDSEQGGVIQLFNLAVDPKELTNLAGVAGYESVTGDLLSRLLSHRVGLTQYTHDKEERRVQRVRTVRA